MFPKLDKRVKIISMELFSHRSGIKPLKKLAQIDSIDGDLLNGLWNALHIYYLEPIRSHLYEYLDKGVKGFLRVIWANYFKSTIKELEDLESGDIIYDTIQEYFFDRASWNEIYDFIEFTANNYPLENSNDYFIRHCNNILEEESSAYRFVNKKIAQITSEEEISTIEESLEHAPTSPVHTHLKNALDKITDRENPDYRNSIKESISAVEAACNLIAGQKSTLDQTLKKLSSSGKVLLHPALQGAFGKLYGYTSDAEGIRHAMLEDKATLQFEDAKFMLVSCAAFINYLRVKATGLGIDF
ncbi:MAG TPA: hypothetical protein VJ327_00575 [Patescibacteria group bacterium]|nr:hypothetical protein [Patescibacteria group bacterium]